MQPTDPSWRRSSHSMGNGGNCVEVAHTPHTVRVRDSKDPAGAELGFRPTPWRAFLTLVGTATHAPRAVRRP
ncbi:DUF397 domain-containing protein [Streptomyces sp. NPDC052012]|uniref:DUF397 domain-containing protein n=1 Tax=Streptomyces sp. NPDC052012 TaxID=3155051 RepID=UPI0034510BDB